MEGAFTAASGTAADPGDLRASGAASIRPAPDWSEIDPAASGTAVDPGDQRASGAAASGTTVDPGDQRASGAASIRPAPDWSDIDPGDQKASMWWTVRDDWDGYGWLDNWARSTFDVCVCRINCTAVSQQLVESGSIPFLDMARPPKQDSSKAKCESVFTPPRFHMLIWGT